MRLKQVKLAGFKSFCDPTTFELPSQLVGIVGPNGCGKSNIIDATRWVLGESRATELRGESMQDVIFNGSLERKPSSRASVELVFDNSLGRIGGAWGGFAEISVKRVLTREGQSTYYINQQPVRRKDVHDIFLGTGLGPRAYAIIGQGTISRIIEAKPDELRVFFEEAAGVSKYKERRRETENRLADTRENLTRVEDILRELHGQISKLDAQAEVAGRYRAMEAERTQKQQWLWLIKRDDAQAEQQLLEKTAESLDLEIEGLQTGLRSAENRMETLREAVHQANDEVSRCQAAYYEVNSEISTLESQIRMIAQNRNQAQARLKSLEEQIQSARALSEGGLQRRQEVEAQLEEARWPRPRNSWPLARMRSGNGARRWSPHVRPRTRPSRRCKWGAWSVAPTKRRWRRCRSAASGCRRRCRSWVTMRRISWSGWRWSWALRRKKRRARPSSSRRWRLVWPRSRPSGGPRRRPCRRP